MMDSFVMYQVGTCDPGLAMRKDCCFLQFFEGIPHVYVLIDRPTEEMLQRANFEKATIEFGLFAHKDVMTLAIKVGDLPWIDAPYSVHLEHWVHTAVASGHSCVAQRPLCGLTATPI